MKAPSRPKHDLLIEKDVELDTRKLYTLAEFKASHAEGGASRFNLKAFADGRRTRGTVAGFDGEQYALPEAVTLLRAVRRRGAGLPIHAAAADPLNFRGILTPDERVSPLARRKVLVA